MEDSGGRFCFDSVTYIPLHAARRSMAAAVPLPLEAATGFTKVYPFPTPASLLLAA